MDVNKLDPPEIFEFPFPPYGIQYDFMTELYKVLENKQLGIFESPTGTGKSLSIICGALRWLKDHNQREKQYFESEIGKLQAEKELLSSNSTDWLTCQAQEIEITRKLNALRIENNKIVEYNEKINKILARKKTKVDRSKYINRKAKKESDDLLEGESLKVENLDDEDDCIEDVHPGEEEQCSDEEDGDEDGYKPVKIFICSRTHSQLSQFVGEIRKSPHGNDVRTVSLASRQSYCINPSVSRLKNGNLINERCLDMQKNQSKTTKKDDDGKSTKKKKKGTTCKCPFYKQANIEEIRDSALTEIQDIEDLVATAKVLEGCPYYGSRKAAEDAQVVLIPYNTILHKGTREANGIKLKNNVVIIDEAHNLLEALAQMHGSEIRQEQLIQAFQLLTSYKTKYSTRFSAQNLLRINQLLFVLKKLKQFMEGSGKNSETTTEVFTVQNFVSIVDIDNYNMFDLVKFSRNAKLAQKLNSFTKNNPIIEEREDRPQKGVKAFLASIENKKKGIIEVEEKPKKVVTILGNPMLAVISFLESLTHSYDDGRILFHRDKEAKLRKFQFLLLNPASQFEDVVKEARAVVVAGGTMKPNAEFRDRLFKAAGGDPSRIVEFSCDHIIPAQNILPVIVTRGVKDENLLFNFENRFSMGDSLKSIIQEACKRITGGIVVFFPSYKYEAWVWQQVKDMTFGRPVFREPQDSGSVDKVLENYADSIKKHKKSGALLFSVVGGKLSEGLNFSDDLGRCVIVVGLPYANIYSADLKEKMSYIEKVEGMGAGRRFYEGLCMKSVNQCIGRAVRHRNDYATVLLLDERYNRSNSKNALPNWIKRSLKTCSSKEAFEIIDEFFSVMRSN